MTVLLKIMTSRYGREWDLYFLGIAKAVAKNSKCLSRKIGSVLVKDKSIVSTGYNGPPRKVSPCSSRISKVGRDCDRTGTAIIRIDGIDYPCPGITFAALVDGTTAGDLIHNTCPRQLIGAKSGERLDLCIAGHSERNALIQAGREGISTKGSNLYCYCNIPCKDCMIEIVNFGVDTVVCLDGPPYDILSEYIACEGKISVVKYAKELV